MQLPCGIGSILLVDLHPLLVLVALEDGLAEEDFFVAVGEGGEGLGGVEVAGGDVVVEGLEGVLEGVVVALVVAAGIADVSEGGFGDEAGVAEQQLVGLVAVADPEFVGLLAVPSDRGFAAGDLVAETVFAAGGYLRNPERAVGAVGEAEEGGAAVFGLDVDGLGGFGGLAP